MSYLNKEERRKFILELAMQIALDDGLNTLTVRHIAQKAGVSVGLIHHYFQNVQALKAEVFMSLVHKILDPKRIDPALSFMEQLLFSLGFTDVDEQEYYIRLWNDAEQNSHLNDEFKTLFLQSIEAWHDSVLILLIAHYPQQPRTQLVDLSWQLIAMTMGLEQLIRLNPKQFNATYIQQLLLSLIAPKH